MWTIIFMVTTAVFAVKWFIARVTVCAFYWYLEEKKIPEPTDSELEWGCEAALKELPVVLKLKKRKR